MGCAGSSHAKGDDDEATCWEEGKYTPNELARLKHALKDNTKEIRKPKPWKHSETITRTQLKQMREEFWDTAPHYGGQKEIWDALRAAAEADLTLARAIVDSAGVIVQAPDLTVCYDERGAKYELPKYVLSEPTNLMRDS